MKIYSLLLISIIGILNVAQAEEIVRIEWGAAERGAQFPELGCGYNGVIICEVDRSMCSTVRTFTTSFWEDFDFVDQVVIRGRQRHEFNVVTSSVFPNGLDGSVKLVVGSTGYTFHFQDTGQQGAEIRVAQTISPAGGFRQTLLGTCVSVSQ